jgi:hypothetical protein
LEGLKPWARIELQRQRVQDLTHAQAAAECLTDYAEPKQRDAVSQSKKGGGGQSQGNGKPKNGGANASSSKGQSSGGQGHQKSHYDKGKSHQNATNKGRSGTISCFLCQGPHRIADCPQKRALNALTSMSDQVSQASDSDSDGEEDARSRRSGKGSKASGSRVGAFHLVNAMEKKRPSTKGKDARPKRLVPPKEQDVVKKSCGKSSTTSLMFVDVKVNGKSIRALVDTGATHNFIAGTEVERLGLSLEKETSRIKAVNSAAQPIYGIAKSVPLKVSTWEGRMDFTVVPMDDFQAILGLDFLRRTKTAVMPYSNSMCVMGDKPCLISTMTTHNSDKFISAMQLKKGVKRGEQTWVAALKLDEFVESSPIPK